MAGDSFKISNRKVYDLNALGNNTSAAVGVAEFRAAGFQVVWDGSSPTGTVKMQGSIDGTNWEDVSGASQALGGAAGNTHWMLNLLDNAYAYVRFNYAHTSGTGTIDIQMLGKG